MSHYLVDFFAGYSAPFQRHFREIWNLSLLKVALLALPASLMIMLQPVFGLLSDRMRTRAFVVGGIITAVAGCGLALPLAAFCGSFYGYLLALAGITVGAAGIAAYHPQGAAFSGRGLGTRSGRAVAFFIFGGTAGFATGLFIPSLFFPEEPGGVDYIAWMPCLAVLGLAALAFQTVLPRLRPKGERIVAPPVRDVLAGLVSEIRPHFRVVLVLWLMVVLRSTALKTFTQFASIYAGEELNLSARAGAALLAGFFLVQALSGVGGTRIGEKLGERRTLAISFLTGSLALVGALAAVHYGWGGPAAFYVLVFLGGTMLGGTTPLNVHAGQRVLKRSTALASGIMIGFGWGAAGLLIPVLGYIGDLFGGPRYTLLAGALLALPGALLALLLPAESAEPATADERRP